jgi:sugar phosphate isomerase/epimerase
VKLAVSNTGWARERLLEILPQLPDHGVEGLVIAPSMVWPGAPGSITRGQAYAFRDQVEGLGMKITGMQSLVDGLPEGLTLASPEVIERLKRQADLAGHLGATSLVLGSSALRRTKPNYRQAVEGLAGVAQVADDNGASLNIEPLSDSDTTFITTTYEGADLVTNVRDVAFPYGRGFGLHLDAAAIAGQPAPNIAMEIGIAHNSVGINSFSASAPNLGSLIGDISVDHSAMANALYANNYTGYVSLEMRQPQGPNPVAEFLAEIEFVRTHYGLNRQ